MVWDWDKATQTAVVPRDVKRAVLYQADSILDGTRARRRHRGPGERVADMLSGHSVVEEAVHDRLETLAYDREHLWHPYASMTDPSPVRLVTAAQGVVLTLGDGREVVDGMAEQTAALPQKLSTEGRV